MGKNAFFILPRRKGHRRPGGKRNAADMEIGCMSVNWIKLAQGKICLSCGDYQHSGGEISRIDETE
jgi:hypothetical protein